MKVSLLCISTGNPFTMPGVAKRPEGFRVYEMAKPGELLYWGSNQYGEPIMSKLDVPNVYHPPCGMSFPYGLVVIKDLHYMRDNPLKNLVVGNPQATFEPAIIPCAEIADDLIGRQSQDGWWNFGLLRIAGDAPTDQEINAAVGVRLRFGHHRVTQAIADYQEAHAGKLKHATYHECDAAQPTEPGGLGGWAWEMGKRLPNTWEALEAIKDSVESHPTVSAESAGGPNETAECVYCFQPVNPRAIVCRWCKSTLASRVEDASTMPPPVENLKHVKVLR